MKKVYKETIAITGGNGFLGSNFYKKFKNKYRFIKYPNRIENLKKFSLWLKKNNFDNFIHFAAITRHNNQNLKGKINKINTVSSIKIIEEINKFKPDKLNFFLFISSSHVYGHSNNKIRENKRRLPQNIYGNSKKKVEDFILKNKKKLSFNIGIARIFNLFGKNQKKGFFIPDMHNKILKQSEIRNVNMYRDFIHVDDATNALELILRKKYSQPINICSGNKFNLTTIIKLINDKFYKKKLSLDSSRGGDVFGDNSKLKKMGMKKFKNIYQILKRYKYQ